MDLINKLLFGKTYGICAFCGRKIKLSDAVFNKEHICVCRECNSFIKIAPFDFLYEGTENVSFVIAPMYYSGLVRDAVHNLKFSSMPGIASALGYYINTYLTVFAESEDNLFQSFDFLVPVPLSDIRLNERGYNQAELLAKEISDYFKIPVESNILIKKRDTAPQSTLSHSERKHNLNGAYECKKPLGGKRILLVDDVCTTGNTLEFCAKTLKKNGAKTVGAITVTHGSTQAHTPLYYDLFT